jgi:hypothetical protein
MKHWKLDGDHQNWMVTEENIEEANSNALSRS